MVFKAGRKKLSAPSKGAKGETKKGADRSSTLVSPSKEKVDNVTCHKPLYYLDLVAGTTGLEPATSAVTANPCCVTC
jgi:hypothetical protein